MYQVLQLLGGGFYLLNKIFMACSEHARNQRKKATARKWRVASWAIYILGLPPWILIFVKERNWIAASVEASGAPAMILGLVLAIRGTTKDSPKWLDRLARICIPLGFTYSLYDFGGLTTTTQWLEIGLVVGFLVGTYQLAKDQYAGYLWYVLMHISCGWLMYIQGYWWLFVQQLVSLLFIVDAYVVTQVRRRKILQLIPGLKAGWRIGKTPHSIAFLESALEFLWISDDEGVNQRLRTYATRVATEQAILYSPITAEQFVNRQ